MFQSERCQSTRGQRSGSGAPTCWLLDWKCPHNAACIQVKCPHNAVYLQVKCPRNAACIQVECPRNAAWIQVECPRNAAWIQVECPRNAVYSQVKRPVWLQSLIISDGFKVAAWSNFMSVLPWKPDISVESWQRPLQASVFITANNMKVLTEQTTYWKNLQWSSNKTLNC